MMRRFWAVFLAGWMMGICAISLRAAPSTNDARTSVDVPGIMSGSEVSDDQVLSMGAFAFGSLVDLSEAVGLPPYLEIDALMVLSNQIIFSVDHDFKWNGTLFADEDLIAYQGGTSLLSTFLDGSSIGVPAMADLDAACLEGGATSVLFSVQKTMTIPTLGVITDDDVIRWSDGAFSIMAQGASDLMIPIDADLNALYYDQTNLYFSLDISARINGQNGSDQDIWQYALISGNVTLTDRIGWPDRFDVTSLDQAVDQDGDGLSDYEEYSGEEEPGTTLYPGSMPLDPGGYTSNPFDPDTDHDGYTDSEEAFVGSNPNNENSMLKLADIQPTESGVIITWGSVPGRIYTVDAGFFSPEFQFVSTISTVIASSGTATSITNTTPAPDEQVYRIKVVGLTD